MIVFSFLLILFGATVYCVLVPDLYQSSDETPRHPADRVGGDGPIHREHRHTRTPDDSSAGYPQSCPPPGSDQRNGAFQGESGEAIAADEMVDKMRRRIDNRKQERTRERNNTFILSFYHENPKVAMTGRFPTRLLLRRRRTSGAAKRPPRKPRSFSQSEVQETRKRLEQQEEKIKQYKLQFGGELPQQEQANLNGSKDCRIRSRTTPTPSRGLQDRKVFWRRRSATSREISREPEIRIPGNPSGSVSQTSPGNLLSELAMRRKKLDELSQKYTPLYPAVVQARWEVEQLEAKIAAMRQAAKKRWGSAGERPNPSTSTLHA